MSKFIKLRNDMRKYSIRKIIDESNCVSSIIFHNNRYSEFINYIINIVNGNIIINNYGIVLKLDPDLTGVDYYVKKGSKKLKNLIIDKLKECLSLVPKNYDYLN